jgi:hypothetical protein
MARQTQARQTQVRATQTRQPQAPISHPPRQPSEAGPDQTPPTENQALTTRSRRSTRRTTAERSDVLVSAVISTYLLTHLHHVLQRAEHGAHQEGHNSLAANYAQLRKVLCLDARSMEDASASGTEDEAVPQAA